MSDNKRATRVAILAADGFEEVELTSPRQTLEEAGISVTIIGPSQVRRRGRIRAWKETDWGINVEIDQTLDEAKPEDYDALVLPGGVMNPDNLRTIRAALDFVRAFFADRRTVAAICHAPWTLIDAGVVKGRRMTSYHSLRTDLANAGAQVVDEAVVVDQNLITSRDPGDLGAFNTQVRQTLAAD